MHSIANPPFLTSPTTPMLPLSLKTKDHFTFYSPLLNLILHLQTRYCEKIKYRENGGKVGYVAARPLPGDTGLTGQKNIVSFSGSGGYGGVDQSGIPFAGIFGGIGAGVGIGGVNGFSGIGGGIGTFPSGGLGGLGGDGGGVGGFGGGFGTGGGGGGGVAGVGGGIPFH